MAILGFQHCYAYEISFFYSNEVAESPQSGYAIRDAMQLLETACGCTVSTRNSAAEIQIQLPQISPEAADKISKWEEKATFPYFHYPQHHYQWASKKENDKVILRLETPTVVGIANGLYGLLQEKLGFRFFHPREMILGDLATWPLPDTWTFSAAPVFDKKGFHLHTQHPLELTQYLHDHTQGEEGLSRIYEYIDWLARNGQNFFEFCLLEDIDMKKWPEYARQFTDYAHARGILCSVDLSLHMFQQKAFKLFRFPPKSLRPFKKQIDRRLAALMRANWDFVNMEFSLAEFVGGMESLRSRLRQHVVDRLRTTYPEVKLLGRQHVVKPEDEIGGSGGHDAVHDTTEPHRGVLVHTVMGYGVEWDKAPVYESENLNHMLDVLHGQKTVRETWFYPESAYWITFDNSIPLFFLPYLQARLDDIQYMEKAEIPGHVTFSSGWEWGYWLIDWSIARWSWNYDFNGKPEEKTAVSTFELLVKDRPMLLDVFREMVTHEMKYLVEEEGMKYMTASTMTDELPKGINKQFLPRPDFTYKWLRHEASASQLDSVEQVLHVLENVRRGYRLLQLKLDSLILPTDPAPVMEIFLATKMTALRAQHRKEVFDYLIGQRRADLSENPKEARRPNLKRAEFFRSEGVKIVRLMERRYRYPANWIAGRHPSYTAYTFGYLWPTHDLFFWEREEKQAEKGKWSPFFMNIWDAKKIAGFKD